MIPITEQDNPNSANIDRLSTFEALRVINSEDAKVARGVEKALPEIAAVVDKVVETLRAGGRLFYIGTGTSGRLGVLDASEIPPTFGVSSDLVQGLIAGGYDALYRASEGNEDDKDQAAEDLKSSGLKPEDAVIGIAASGRTPYTIGAVEFAGRLGCFTACITSVPDAEITKSVEISIVANVGAEVITGSTRMKAGTAQKMILNMISTVTMVRLGYVLGNRMTNLKSSNEKLKERSLRILISETGLDDSSARDLMLNANDDLRIALVMHRTDRDYQTALKALDNTDFVVENAVAILK